MIIDLLTSLLTPSTGMILGLVGLAWLIRRRFRKLVPSDPSESDRTPGWVWGLIATIAVSYAYFDSPAWSGTAGPWLARWVLMIGFIAIVLAALGPRFYPYRDNWLLKRLIQSEDYAGAIAILEAKVAPDLASGTAPADLLPDSPWTAPRSVTRSPLALRTLAVRFNLLGLLELKRDNLARALNWFDQADRSGAPVLDARANRGLTLAKLGRADEGLPLIRSNLEQLPPTSHLHRYQITLQLASALIAAGQLAEARATLDRAARGAKQVWRVHALARRPLDAGGRMLADRLAAAEAGAASRAVPVDLDARGDRD